MNYIGSKYSLLNFLENSIQKIVNKNCNIFCDLFAGTGVVGALFKQKNFKIISNDIQYYSYVLNRNLIGNHQELLFKGLFNEIPDLKSCLIPNRKKIVVEYLNKLKLKKGFIFNNYCLGVQNTKTCNANIFLMKMV
jgi:adenine-specific DNA-methyltransferase